MKVDYDFAVPSRVYLAGEELPPLKFNRAEIGAAVQKPREILPGGGYVLNPAVDRDSLLAMLVADRLTRITISLESKEEVPRERFPDVLYPIAYQIVSSLKSWIRVLTHQYWIGHKYLDANQEAHRVFITSPSERELISPPQVATGLSWGKPVTRDIWDSIGLKLRNGLMPRLGQLLFCDALLYLLEFNLDAGAGLLGIACELEVSNFLREGRRARNEKNPSADFSGEGNNRSRKRSSKRLRESIEKIGQLYQPAFCVDPQTLDSFDELMTKRHEAVHQALTPPLDGAPIPASRDGMRRLAVAEQPLVSHAQAAQQLFGWLDALRARTPESPQ